MVAAVECQCIFSDTKEYVCHRLFAIADRSALAIEPPAWSLTGIGRFAGLLVGLIANLSYPQLHLAALQGIENLIGGHLEALAQLFFHIEFVGSAPFGIVRLRQGDVFLDRSGLALGGCLGILIRLDGDGDDVLDNLIVVHRTEIDGDGRAGSHLSWHLTNQNLTFLEGSEDTGIVAPSTREALLVVPEARCIGTVLLSVRTVGIGANPCYISP